MSYDGTAMHGWARQPGQRTVQSELEQGLSMVLRCPVDLTVAGRTDAGVHATGQRSTTLSACSSSPWTVRFPGCLAHPCSAVPS